MAVGLGLVITPILTVINTKDNIEMIRKADLDCTAGKMEQAMRENF